MEAAAKLLGGAYYNYGVVGDALPGVEWVPVAEQRSALMALLQTLHPDELTLDPSLVTQLSPKPFASLQDRERFSSQTSPLLDPEGMAYRAASWTLTHVLQPQRLARIDSQSQEDWNVGDVFRQVSESTWGQEMDSEPRRAAVQRAVQLAVLDQLLELARQSSASPSVRAQAEYQLARLGQAIKKEFQSSQGTFADQSHRQSAMSRIQRYLNRTEDSVQQVRDPALPPGSPIGQ